MKRIRVEVPKDCKAGCVWGDGGVVTKVTSGGAAAKAGVEPSDWRIVNVQGKSVTPSDTAKLIGDLLAAARSAGQYYLLFETTQATEEPGTSTGDSPVDEGPLAELKARLDAILDAEPETKFDIAAGASEINDWLLLGTFAVAKEILRGKRPDLRVDAVLSCVYDVENPDNCFDEEALQKANIGAYGGFWAYDNEEHDIIADYWQHARPFLLDAREKGMRVLINCSMGVNRSAAIACAFLVEREGLDLCDAAGLLHHRRGGVLGNEGFRRQLAALALRTSRS